jgi:general secretion pathway protein L
MNAKDFFNMDMETVLQWLLLGWRWWVNELMEMLPPEWRERLSRRVQAVAEVRDGHIAYRSEDGTPLAAKPRGRIAFLVPRANVLTREVDLPLLPMSDVKRMVALDIDRLTPFQADQVYFDAEIVSRDADAGRQLVAIGVLPRDAAAQLLAYAAASDLHPSAMGIAGESGGQFDFIAAMREASGGDAAQKRAIYWWAGAGALIVLNLFLLTYRDSNNLDQLRQAVEAQQGPVSVALRTRDKVDRETARRAALMDEKKRASPMPVLNAVTAAMPLDAWVKRFEWNGRTVHVQGQRKTSTDILARLEASPVLRNAHSLALATRADPSNPNFDLAAEREIGREVGKAP